MSYAVFATEFYYPLGGWRDYKGSHFTQEEAEAALREEIKEGEEFIGSDWGHVVNLDTLTITLERERVGANRTEIEETRP